MCVCVCVCVCSSSPLLSLVQVPAKLAINLSIHTQHTYDNGVDRTGDRVFRKYSFLHEEREAEKNFFNPQTMLHLEYSLRTEKKTPQHKSTYTINTWHCNRGKHIQLWQAAIHPVQCHAAPVSDLWVCVCVCVCVCECVCVCVCVCKKNLRQGLTSILVTYHFHSTCCMCALVKNAGGETDGERDRSRWDRASVQLSTRCRPLLSVISYFMQKKLKLILHQPFHSAVFFFKWPGNPDP